MKQKHGHHLFGVTILTKIIALLQQPKLNKNVLHQDVVLGPINLSLRKSPRKLHGVVVLKP